MSFLPLDDVIRITAEHYRVPTETLTTPTRDSSIAWLRRVAMYVAHTVALIPYDEIAPAFGVKSASGVFRAMLDVASRKNVAADIEVLRKRICAPPPAPAESLEPWELPFPSLPFPSFPSPHSGPFPAPVATPRPATSGMDATLITASSRWSGTILPSHTLDFIVRTA